MTVDNKHPPEAAHAKEECKVIGVQQISGYLGCDHGKLVTSLRHLAAARAAVELCTGEWVLIQRIPAPPYTRRGKLITMTRRGEK
jgi:hypothetical protein